MGAAIAPAAAQTLHDYLTDTSASPLGLRPDPHRRPRRGRRELMDEILKRTASTSGKFTTIAA